MCYFGWHQQVRMSYLPGNQVKSAEKDDVPAYAAFVYSICTVSILEAVPTQLREETHLTHFMKRFEFQLRVDLDLQCLWLGPNTYIIHIYIHVYVIHGQMHEHRPTMMLHHDEAHHFFKAFTGGCDLEAS